MYFDTFKLRFANNNGGDKNCYCGFRKYDDIPLLIICFINNQGTNWLKEITEEIIIDNANIKYNFRIQTVNNEEKIDCNTEARGTMFFWIYPEIFDFTKSDSLIIEYAMESPKDLVGITFNEEANDLTCQTIGKQIKRCTVPKSHFEGKKNGYYFTMHSNHLNGKSYSYDAPPVKVILNDSPDPEPTDPEPTDPEPTDPEPTEKPSDDSKGNIISFISYYWLLLILIMI